MGKTDIREKWDRFCNLLEINKSSSDEIFGWLDRFYSDPGRHYHNWNHIESCLNNLESLSEKDVENYNEIEYSLWFHDVIYSFGFQDGDEEASAKLACICAEKMGISSKIDTFVVSSLIRITKDHEPEIRPYIGFKDAQALIIDIDLAIFSEDKDTVLKYDQAIRNEYFWVPFDNFSKGRELALKKYYYRDDIYLSSHLKDAGLVDNNKAKNNLKMLIDKYGS